MNERFTDEQAKEIKLNLVRGKSLTALARMWGTSTETISKIKRGLTYKHVTVLGEERLRPEVRVVAPTARDMEVLSGVTDEEIEAQGLAMLEMQNQMALAKTMRKAVGEVDDMTAEALKKYGA